MAVILFWQLWHIWHSSLMHTCLWRIRIWTCLKHRFKIFDTHGEAFFWTNSAAINPHGSQTRGVRNAAGLKFCEPSEEHPNPAWGCSFMWLYLFMYIIYTYKIIYIYINISDCRGYTYPNLWRFKSDGYTNFSSWTAPSSAESVFDSPKVIQGHPVASTTGCLFQFTQTFPYVAWRFIIHFYGHSHHEKMGVSQIIGLASQPSRSWSAWWRNFTILKNMSSSMGRIIIPYMGK